MTISEQWFKIKQLTNELQKMLSYNMTEQEKQKILDEDLRNDIQESEIEQDKKLVPEADSQEKF